MRSQLLGISAALLVGALAPSLHAQRQTDINADMLDRLLRGYKAEQTEVAKVDPQLKAAEDKLAKFIACRKDFEAAANASGSAVAGFAARLAMRAKCGASSEDDFVKDRDKILEGPDNAGAKAANLKLADYRSNRDRIKDYLRGDRNGFSKGSLDLFGSREAELSSAFGISAAANASAAPAGVGPRGAGAPGVWTMDFAWAYIGQLFAVQYLSGATMFETTYQPGQWTKWQITTAGDNEKQTVERAFLFTTADGGEWWRMKTTSGSDTVVFEGLFKPMGDTVKQLVRMRGKFPGNAEAQEMIVPQAMSMMSSAGSLGGRPTAESVAGATVGTETAAGVSARHVRYGTGAGTLDWWLSDARPGGWVRFSASDQDKKEMYRMEMTEQGTGATSELGVTR